ncbi:hypothetical protein LTR36_008879 [Oleoguttula mirabilis]|uniref:Uncharacterized protein n=1 Tax=Oleoguttula mirabilis TaxID=1507867 RepID=A0AAV9J7T8_9PEZI|nr:hypothetical protein LTR36_008879 [Oleoguttula mirabilis]
MQRQANAESGAANGTKQQEPERTWSEKVMFLVPNDGRDSFNPWSRYAAAGKTKEPIIRHQGPLSQAEPVYSQQVTDTDAEAEEEEEQDFGEPMPMQVLRGTLRLSGALDDCDPLVTFEDRKTQPPISTSEGKMADVFRFFGGEWMVEKRRRNPAQPFLMIACDGCLRCNAQSRGSDAAEGNARNDGGDGLGINLRRTILRADSRGAPSIAEERFSRKAPVVAAGASDDADPASRERRTDRAKRYKRRLEKERKKKAKQDASEPRHHVAQAASFIPGALTHNGGQATDLNKEAELSLNTRSAAGKSADNRRSNHRWPDGPTADARGGFSSVSRRFDRIRVAGHRRGESRKGGKQ